MQPTNFDENEKCKLIDEPLKALFEVLHPNAPVNGFLLAFVYYVDALREEENTGKDWGRNIYQCYCNARKILRLNTYSGVEVYLQFHEKAGKCFAELFESHYAIRMAAWETWIDLRSKDLTEPTFAKLYPEITKRGDDGNLSKFFISEIYTTEFLSSPAREEEIISEPKPDMIWPRHTWMGYKREELRKQTNEILRREKLTKHVFDFSEKQTDKEEKPKGEEEQQ